MLGGNMSDIFATPIVDDQFWIVKQDGARIATLHKNANNKFMLSNTNGELLFNEKSELTEYFGNNFFMLSNDKVAQPVNSTECHGYPTSCMPYNAMYDVQRKLPLFTKSERSKSIFCAGYYRIKFDYYWNTTFCPKLITVDRYRTSGPYKSETEMKQAREYAKSNQY
jgi:hypothetical protein